jgi:hypothetical protein
VMTTAEGGTKAGRGLEQWNMSYIRYGFKGDIEGNGMGIYISGWRVDRMGSTSNGWVLRILVR